MRPDPLVLNQQQAAQALGVSVNHFKVHVRPVIPAVYIGGERRWRVATLERYAQENEA